ncbi:MAG TPA: YhfC family glutamic-type intramembrane protease [Chloroflexota bacterium]|jgi:uncharacterized membrane protein YhfC
MTPLAAMHLQAALMVILPILFWSVATRRLRLGRHGWAVIGFGCLFFMLSQFVNTPLRLLALALGVGTGVAQIVVFALISGLGEELARYVAMRWVPQIRAGLDRRVATAYGLGHGGFESLMLGLGVLATALLVANGGPDVNPALAAQAQIIAATPPYVFLFGVLERLIAIALQVGLSLIVMRAVVSGDRRQLLLAIAVHALANGGALALQRVFDRAILTEGYLAVVAGLALVYGAATRDPSDRDLGADPVLGSPDGGVSDSEVVGAGRS